MGLPENYKPENYKSKDPWERLGFSRSQSLTPAIIEPRYRNLMDYWTQMRVVQGMIDQVAPAQTALTEAKEILINPKDKANAEYELSPDASKSNVLLIGGPGAGKSALVGAIYDVCGRANVLDPFNARLSKDNRSNVTQNLAALKRFCDPRIAKRDRTIPRVKNEPGSKIWYDLILALRGKDRLQVRFIDTAGEDLHRVLGARDQENVYLAGLIKECQAAILVVDAQALHFQSQLASQGLDARRMRNMPENVKVLVQDWLQINPEAPRLFCIVPSKIESDLYDKSGGRSSTAAQDIIARTIREFKDTIDCLEQNGNCAIVITPVETCGCLRIASDWRPEPCGEYPLEHWEAIPDYRNVSASKAYSPLDCELPLVYILNFFLKLIDHKGGSQPSDVLGDLRAPDEFVDFLSQFIDPGQVRSMRDKYHGFLDKAISMVNVLTGLFKGRFGQEDTKDAVRRLLNRKRRFNAAWISGNTDLLQLD